MQGATQPSTQPHPHQRLLHRIGAISPAQFSPRFRNEIFPKVFKAFPFASQ
jgi:hypothetical protein